MSVLRIKAYHSEAAIDNGIEYAANAEKTTLDDVLEEGLYTAGLSENDLDENVKNAFSYSTNTDKTTYEEDGREMVLVSGVNCKPDTATLQFKDDMDKYHRNGHREVTKTQHSKRLMRAKLDKNGEPVRDKAGELIYDPKAPVYHDENGKCVYQEYDKQTEARTAYMWVLSFGGKDELGYKPDPRLVHRIGMEFCEGFLGDYRCTVSTHVNTEHIHNHIMQCAYSMDGTHKYKDDMAMLQAARDFADDLSLRYGIPIIINKEKDKGHSMSWFEWKLRHDGKSWKDQMEEDLRTALDMADNFEQYKQILQSSGYTLRETENHITYYMPDTDKRCRDTLLSEGFLKEDILKHFNQAPEKEKPKEKDERVASPVFVEQKPIHISRYTKSGRRRTDIEMILLVAIAIIQHIKDKLFSPQVIDMKKSFEDNPVYKPYTWKLQQMQDTLTLVQNLGIQDVKDLDERISKAGAELSHAKAEVRSGKEAYQYEKTVLAQVENAVELINRCNEEGLDTSKLYIQKAGQEQIREKKAKLMPVSPEQRRKIYIELEKHPEYRVSVKYDLMTYKEAQEVISFLKGKTSIKPDVLVLGEERLESRLEAKYDKIYQNKQEKLKEKYGDKKASQKQITEIVNILEIGAMDSRIDELLFEIAGNTIDPESMTYYEALRFINYFMDSPVVHPPADDFSRQQVDAICKDRNLTLYREPTLADVKQIKAFAQGDLAEIPSICDPEKPSESTLKGIREMARIKKVQLSIKPEDLTKRDASELYEYLLYYGRIPEFMTSMDDISTDMQFQYDTQELSPEHQTLMYQLKDAMTELSSLGITTENLLEMELELTNSIKAHEDALLSQGKLKEEYKTLSRIKYNLNLAQNNFFTHGPEYKDKDKVKTEEVEKQQDLSEEEKKQEQEREDKKQQERKTYREPDKYFEKTYGEDR